MSRPAILALCTTGIGDTLLCIPALAALGAAFDLDVVAHRQRRALLVGAPFVRGLYSYGSNPLFTWRLRWTLGRRPYHRLVVMHANQHHLGLLRFLRYEQAANIQGWQDPELRLESLPNQHPHVIEQRLALATWAGAPAIGSEPRVYLSQQELAQGERWLAVRGLSPLQLRVAMCLGAADGYKIWPAERFGRVAAALIHDEAQVLAVGSRAEAGLHRQAQQAAGKDFPAALGLNLRLMAAILGRVDLLISNDTGPMHLAAAMGTPLVAIFGPTDPAYIGPRGSRSLVLRPAIECETCLVRDCPRPTCLEALEPEQVIEAARQMLSP